MNKVLNNQTLHFLEDRLIEELSKIELFQEKNINDSPRAMGDTVQKAIGEILPGCFPNGLIRGFRADFARKAMEDVAFSDMDGNYYAIDIKTHNKATKFNMPNLISVERLARFYRDEKRFFVILFVEYIVEQDHMTFTNVRFIPVEHIDWSCLRIGALGNGQLQLVNSNRIIINRTQTRAEWMLSLCDALDMFYPKEIEKIKNKLMKNVKDIRDYWKGKQ